MSSPLVSVVIPTYNMARFVGGAIRSVLAQTHANLEVHVVDDGSTDNTEAVVKPFLADPRVTYYRQENGGGAKARNTGLKAARGEFIGFIDADDEWTPDKLARQLECFTRPTIGVVYTNYQWVDEDLKPLPTWHPSAVHSGYISDRLLVENFISAYSCLVRRECFDAVGMFNESLRLSEDYDMWLRISARYEFHYLDHITMLYRRWPGQISRNVDKMLDCAVTVMNSFLQNHPNVVAPRTVRLAWAHTYTGTATSFWKLGQRKEALQSYARALRFQPTYVPAWKGIAKTLLISAQGTQEFV